MRRSPFAPLLNFLNHEMADTDSIRSGKWSQPPLQPNTRQNELCTTMAWLGMTSKGQDQSRVEPLHGHQVCWQQLQKNTSQTHYRPSVPFAVFLDNFLQGNHGFSTKKILSSRDPHQLIFYLTHILTLYLTFYVAFFLAKIF